MDTLNVIPDLGFVIVFLKAPSNTDFSKCRKEIAGSLINFSNRCVNEKWLNLMP